MNGPDSDGHGLTLANTANKEAGIHTPSHEQRDPPTRDLADTSGGPFEDVDLEKDSHCALGDVGTTSSTIQDPGPSACIEKELHALAQLIQSRKLPDKSSCTSIAFANIAAVQSGAQFGIQPTFAAVLLRPAEAARRLLSKRRKPETPLLNGIDGIVRNGEMLLVLGRPGNVSSMLLKALSGQAQDGLHITGEIKYNGIDARDFKRRFKGDSIYVPDVDIHFPHLLTGSTLDFASDVKTPRIKVAGQSTSQAVRDMTSIYSRLLGIQHTLETKVGNEYVQGVSGGERKRVTLAEGIATRASVTMWDNPTHGLDSSTALEFITTLRDMTKSFQQTAVVALYQAGESLTDQFDKVTVLYLGRQIFFGTLPDSKRYFEDMGFECRPHQTTADFLTAITDPTARRAKPGWEDRVPRAPEDFVKLWQSSPEYSKLRADIQDYHREFSDSNAAIANYEAYHSAIKSKRQRPGSIYTVDLPTQFSANLKRAFRRFIGDRAFLGATAFSSIYMSLIMGSLFYNVTDTTSGFFSKGGALFFAILFNSLQTMGEIAMFYSQRPIIRRQYTYAMYHPFLDALASLVVEYPYKIVNVTVFDIVLYFMVGLKQTPDAFFTLWLVTYLATLVMSAYFRTVAALTNSPEAAIGVAGISVLAYSIYTGYLIPKPSMHPWFKWITYINPLSYAFEALVANEFHDTLATCASVVPSGPEYTNASAGTQVCAVTGSEPGQLSVSGDVYIETSFDYRNSHVWRNVGILCVFLCGFVAALAVATEFMTSSSKDTRDRLCYRKGHGPDQVKGAVDEEENWKAEDVLTRTASPASANTDLVTQKLLTWEGVGYDIALHDGSQQRLLNGIDGYVRPGTLTALMGESGAGKTTLLRALAKRLHGGKISGECRVNGEPPDRSFHRMTGFVEQQDVHLASSTVREALRFSAKLRQPEEIPFTERMDYVEKVIEMLEMDDFAEAIIGTPGSGGLNIEQRKRTTIAVELVAKPEILLFLDEPTSGLDSLAAWSIVRLLRKLANSGQTILCTIHQPSSVLFEQFDRLLLLGKGGVPVYFGDVGENSQAVLRYFEERSGLSCPLGHNPAEFILDVIGTLTTRNWNEVWKNSTECHELSKDIQQLEKQFHPAPREHFKEHGHLRRDVGPGATFARPWTTQYLAVQPRLFLHHWRTPRYIMGKVSLNVLAGLFLGFTFFKEGSSVQGLQNKLFACFTSAILGMPMMNQFQPQFAELATLFTERENPSGLYHWSAFVLSVLVSEITLNILAGTLFFFPWYFGIDFARGWMDGTAGHGIRGLYMWLLLMTLQMWLSTFATAVASLAPNPQTAAILTTLLASFVVAFNGVLQPLSQLPQFWHFMYHLSPYTYVMSGFVSNAIHGTHIICAKSEINTFQPPLGETCIQYAGSFIQHEMGYLLNPDATTNCQYCRFATGDQYLLTRNMDYNERWRNFGFMFAYIAFNAGAAFLFFYLAKVATFQSERAEETGQKSLKV